MKSFRTPIWSPNTAGVQDADVKRYIFRLQQKKQDLCAETGKEMPPTPAADVECERVWAIEESLWTGDAERYRASIDNECLMVVPAPPFVMSGQQAIEAVSSTPRWSQVTLSERRVAFPQDGLIVVAYKAEASRDEGETYQAHCTSTYRRLGHDDWHVVQHQQTPPLVAQAVG